MLTIYRIVHQRLNSNYLQMTQIYLYLVNHFLRQVLDLIVY